MPYGFLDALMTPGVRAVQAEMGAAEVWDNFKGHRAFDRLGEQEIAFIGARDSLFMATIGETGWPYIQHRGGQPGFLKVLDEKTLAFPDFKGNRQYISVGNVTTDARVALILVDYPHRSRMKILAHVEVIGVDERPDVTKQVIDPGYKAKVERIIILHLVTFDWNCPQHITPRFTEAEVTDAIKPLTAHIASLETEVVELRRQLSAKADSAPTTTGL